MNVITCITLVAIIFYLVVKLGGALRKRDDSDDPDGPRSDLTVHTDHLTGVQYLSGPRGGLILRVDANGKPIIKKN